MQYYISEVKLDSAVSLTPSLPGFYVIYLLFSDAGLGGLHIEYFVLQIIRSENVIQEGKTERTVGYSEYLFCCLKR